MAAGSCDLPAPQFAIATTAQTRPPAAARRNATEIKLSAPYESDYKCPGLPWSDRCTSNDVSTFMKPSASCLAALLVCLGTAVSAQVSSNSAQAGSNSGQGSSNSGQGSSNSTQGSSNSAQGSSNPAQGGSNSAQGSSNSAQGSSNPAQGSSNSAQGSSNSAQGRSSSEPVPNTPTSRPEQLFGTLAAPTPSVNSALVSTPGKTQQAPARPIANNVQTDEQRRACAAVANSPANSSQFPGVSASQFRRAGVSADAFTRPGVSAEQLSVLTPGGGSRPCQAPRDVILYPEPARQPRPIPSPIDQP
jgi:hypothetical protein